MGEQRVGPVQLCDSGAGGGDPVKQLCALDVWVNALFADAQTEGDHGGKKITVQNQRGADRCVSLPKPPLYIINIFCGLRLMILLYILLLTVIKNMSYFLAPFVWGSWRVSRSLIGEASQHPCHCTIYRSVLQLGKVMHCKRQSDFLRVSQRGSSQALAEQRACLGSRGLLCSFRICKVFTMMITVEVLNCWRRQWPSVSVTIRQSSHQVSG